MAHSLFRKSRGGWPSLSARSNQNCRDSDISDPDGLDGKQLEEGRLARRGEIHDTAAGVAARPALGQHSVKQCRTERAREMIAPLAPVEAASAERAARRAEFRKIDTEILDKAFPVTRKLDLADVESEIL